MVVLRRVTQYIIITVDSQGSCSSQAPDDSVIAGWRQHCRCASAKDLAIGDDQDFEQDFYEGTTWVPGQCRSHIGARPVALQNRFAGHRDDADHEDDYEDEDETLSSSSKQQPLRCTKAMKVRKSKDCKAISFQGTASSASSKRRLNQDGRDNDDRADDDDRCAEHHDGADDEGASLSVYEKPSGSLAAQVLSVSGKTEREHGGPSFVGFEQNQAGASPEFCRFRAKPSGSMAARVLSVSSKTEWVSVPHGDDHVLDDDAAAPVAFPNATADDAASTWKSLLAAHNACAMTMFQQLPNYSKEAIGKNLAAAGAADEPAKRMGWFTFKNCCRLALDEATWQQIPEAHMDIMILNRPTESPR